VHRAVRVRHVWVSTAVRRADFLGCPVLPGHRSISMTPRIFSLHHFFDSFMIFGEVLAVVWCGTTHLQCTIEINYHSSPRRPFIRVSIDMIGANHQSPGKIVSVNLFCSIIGWIRNLGNLVSKGKRLHKYYLFLWWLLCVIFFCAWDLVAWTCFVVWSLYDSQSEAITSSRLASESTTASAFLNSPQRDLFQISYFGHAVHVELPTFYFYVFPILTHLSLIVPCQARIRSWSLIF
jgi:hypothetical protein